MWFSSSDHLIDKLFAMFSTTWCAWVPKWTAIFERLSNEWNYVIYHTCTFIHRKGKNHKPYDNGVDKRIWMNLANNKNLRQVIALINFITSTQSKKHKTKIILTMKMGQTINSFKTKPQGFLCWSFLLCTKHDHFTFCPYLTFVSKFPLACKWRDVGTDHNWTWSK